MEARIEALEAELAAARAREAATAEILEVINSSPGDLEPVFQAMLQKAHTLCEASFGALMTYDGERFHAVAHQGTPAPFREFLAAGIRPGPEDPFGRMVQGAALFHIHDLSEIAAQYPDQPLPRAAVDLGGIRTLLVVPLRKGSELLGVITAYRREVRPFTGKQIALLQNFAAQAVIAMDNARLLTETREALEQQTATAELLQVINGSPGDLTPVFEAILEKAHTVCGAAQGTLAIYDGEYFRPVAMRGVAEPFAERLRQGIRGRNNLITEPLIVGERFVLIPDALATGNPALLAANKLTGTRTLLSVPLRKDELLLGMIVAFRQEVRPFSDKEIALLGSFAAQAVIAIENARLLTETREALEQQTATAEVLQIVNASPGNLAPVFDGMLERAMRLCEASFGYLLTYDGGGFLPVADRGHPAFSSWVREQGRIVPEPGTINARIVEGEAVVQVADVAEDPFYRRDSEIGRAVREIGRFRTVLTVALRKDGALRGVIHVYRQEVRPFDERQVALLQNFAAQAVIAMENARLLDEIRSARDTAEETLAELRATQQQLVVQQKMAALGQLTAGIAHEIKNPLNFVNNFAGLSVELLDELKQTARPALTALDEQQRGELDEAIDMLTGNLERIVEHGRRADGIVTSMLLHSRAGSGDWQSIDMNALVDEALNLAYHGARAQDQGFNITLERDLDLNLAPIEVVPQDVMRVFLNLFGNGFYAANKRSHEADAAFRPMLKVTTHELGDAVEIRVRDNGIGIAPEHREKLFQPFFTTKPSGEGTGLGLSISYDIVTARHGGMLSVNSEPGEFTEFIVSLPRRQHPPASGRTT